MEQMLKMDARGMYSYVDVYTEAELDAQAKKLAAVKVGETLIPPKPKDKK